MRAKAIMLLIVPLFGLLALAQEPDAAIAKLALEKRAATIRLEVQAGPDDFRKYDGAFISRDGLALVSLMSVVWRDRPSAFAADGAPLKQGRLIGTFPTAGVALMKFEHQPKAWLELAQKDLEVRDVAAMIVCDVTKRAALDGKVLPVVGKILAERSGLGYQERQKQFVKLLSLGSGLSAEQRANASSGPFVIDKDGRLAAFVYSMTPRRQQTLIMLAPVAKLGAEIEQMAKQHKEIAVPFAAQDNPVEAVVADSAYDAMERAAASSGQAEVRSLLHELLKRHPTSLLLKQRALYLLPYDSTSAALVSLKDFPAVESVDPTPAQIINMICRSRIFSETGMLEKAIEAEEYVVKVSPDDEPNCRYILAMLHLRREQPEKAEPLMREAYPFLSDTIQFVEDYEVVLTKLGRLDEADKMSERIYELAGIYR